MWAFAVGICKDGATGGAGGFRGHCLDDGSLRGECWQEVLGACLVGLWIGVVGDCLTVGGAAA